MLPPTEYANYLVSAQNNVLQSLTSDGSGALSTGELYRSGSGRLMCSGDQSNDGIDDLRTSRYTASTSLLSF